MTRYDDVVVADIAGGGPHPLAGVPQEALDAARDSLIEMLSYGFDEDDYEAMAHAVLMAALKAWTVR